MLKKYILLAAFSIGVIIG